MPPAHAPSDPDPVQRLQEHVMHTERSVEELSEEIAELNLRMRQLADRLASIEGRLIKLVEDPAEPTSE